MIKKQIIIIILILNTIVAAAQVNLRFQNKINGKIIGKALEADSIYFSFGFIDSKYYENCLEPSKLIANEYEVNNNLHYPQMYKISFLTDRNIRSWREGLYFIDPTTTTIKTNFKFGNCSETNGTTAKEYQNKFIPFVTKGTIYDCKSNYLSDLFNSQNKKIDSLIYNYVTNNPNSYVALWKLVERFTMLGQSEIRQQTLEKFSGSIKSGRVWKDLDKDFKHAIIRENEVFPIINVKTYDLDLTKLKLPKAKFTLIDYWFARCRPCLDTIPMLKKLYSNYKNNGFEIVSISVDETKDIPIWQKRVKEHGLVWMQYLEENNFKVNELGIKLYPTFILLDSKGRILWKDFDLHELNTFLEKNL